MNKSKKEMLILKNKRKEIKAQIVVTYGKWGRDTEGSWDTVTLHLLAFSVNIWIFSLSL